MVMIGRRAQKIRNNCIKILNSYGGKLIEIPFTQNVTRTSLIQDFDKNRSTPDFRKSILRRLIKSKKIVRIIEAHSPISALISENLYYNDDQGMREFDGFWSSSLTDSTEMGKPDIEVLDLTARAQNINNIFDVTSKPLIMDLDTGGSRTF